MRGWPRQRLTSLDGHGASLLCAAAVVIVVTATGLASRWERASLDLRFRSRPHTLQHSSVTVVALRAQGPGAGDLSLRAELAAFLQEMSGLPETSRPAAIALDILLSSPSSSGDAHSDQAIDQILASQNALKTVVHPVIAEIEQGGTRLLSQTLAPVLRHTLEPPSSEVAPLFSDWIELAHPLIAESLYESAAGIGSVTLSEAEGLHRGESIHALPLLIALPMKDGAPPRLLAGLPLTAVLTGLCRERELKDCVRISDTLIIIDGQTRLNVPIDGSGRFQINYRKRFLPELLSSGPCEKSTSAPDLVQFGAQPLGPDQKFLERRLASFGGCPFPPVSLAGRYLLVVDWLERDDFHTPFGDYGRQSTVLAQVMANILEADPLRDAPAWAAWAAAILLPVSATLARGRRAFSPRLGWIERFPARFQVVWEALLPVIPWPEALLAIIWGLLAFGLFWGLSVSIPVVLPLFALSGSFLGRQLARQSGIARKLEALRVNALEQEEVRTILQTHLSSLTDRLWRIEEIHEEEHQRNTLTEEEQAALDMPASELASIQSFVRQALNVLAGRAIEAKASRSLSAPLIKHSGDKGVQALQTEIEVLLNQYIMYRAEHPPPGAHMRHLLLMLGEREAGLRRLLARLGEALDDALRGQSALLVGAASSQDHEALGSPDPYVLARSGFLTCSASFSTKLRQLLDQYAPSHLTIMICGETGTGKELLARAVHDHSLRRNGPYAAKNLAESPEAQIEAELFGNLAGIAPGVRSRKGLFVTCDGGTLFLDECHQIPLHVQGQLLRVLEAREVVPVGADPSKPIKVDVRLVCATNESLEQLCRKGTFRFDLYQRLKGHMICVPPLRERRYDIVPLAEHFLAHLNLQNGRQSRFSQDALDTMASYYHWPGNVREVKTCVEVLAVGTAGGEISAAAVLEHCGVAQNHHGSRAATYRTPPREVAQNALTQEYQRRLVLLRDLEFDPEACAKDPRYPLDSRANADLDIRRLCCWALATADWDVSDAAALLCGPSNTALCAKIQKRMMTFLRNLQRTYPDETLASATRNDFGEFRPLLIEVIRALRMKQVSFPRVQ